MPQESPYSGAAQMCRTSVLPQAKPWRRGNSLAPSMSKTGRFKDSVKEVAQGYECGITFEKFQDIKQGDVIEAFLMEQIEV